MQSVSKGRMAKIKATTGIYSGMAPKPVGPYSQAVHSGSFIFCSGQIGTNKNGIMAAGGIGRETKQAIENLKCILSEAGAGLKNVVRVDIFLARIEDFDKFNRSYAEYFANEPKPARQTVAVSKLPKNASVEISCIAYLGK